MITEPSIAKASRELYQSLRNYEGVVGTGVVSSNDTMYIVVYLENTSEAVKDKIPSKYKGTRVKTEISAPFFSL